MLAMITGASAGIGAELAHLFAADKHDLILVARREEKLEEIANTLRDKHGVMVHVLASDLGVPGAANELFDAVEELGLEVDALVNNAGLGQSGPFAESEMGMLATMLHVNITALTELTRLFLPGMIARDRGHIMNVGSTAGFQPGPGMAVYYATKAYVYSFTEALVEELKESKVTITNLAPGATDTEFQDRAGIADSLLFAAGVMDAKAVAKAGYNGMLSGTSLVVPGLKNKVGASTVHLVPRPVIRKIVSKINSKR